MTLHTDIALPEWFESYRPHQTTAIEEILDAYRSGVDVVVLDAPTGSGKTLIAESVRQALAIPFGDSNGARSPGPPAMGFGTANQRVTRASYICSTKSLQSQFLADYPYAHLLKGRANYPTELYPERFASRFDSISCDDCTKQLSDQLSCIYCSSPSVCPYEIAKHEALQADIAVLNTAYFLTEANYIGKFSGRELVIADECDLLDDAVTGFVTVAISESRVKQLDIRTPRKVTVESSWLEWVKEAEPIVKAKAREARERARNSSSTRNVKQANYLSNLQRNLGGLHKGIEAGGWIYTGTRDKVEFKPIWADQVAKEALWKHGKKWLLMSATVISAESMLSSLGLDNANAHMSVACPSTFPVENRPIYIRPVANMKAADKDVEWPKLIPALKQIAEDHGGERILVHTVSYELTRFLGENLRQLCRPLFIYEQARDRDAALQDYLATPGAILLAPSFDRGVDLPGDACRVQVIVKVPFKYLGDRQVNKRLYSPNGQSWYVIDAIRTLVQMTGRGVRSETDTCTTYILDSNFVHKLWNGYRKYFPKWWRDALIWRR